MLQIHNCHTWEAGNNGLLFETAVKNYDQKKKKKRKQTGKIAVISNHV